MWKNKHIVVAMLVAPVLAIFAWFAVDAVVSEKPHAAKPGSAYLLVARSNCRYASGRCDLDNNDFRLTLEAEASGLRLTSRHPLALANAGLGPTPAAADEARQFTAADETGLVWTLNLEQTPQPGDILRVAVVADSTTYYAELTAAFLAEEGAAR